MAVPARFILFLGLWLVLTEGNLPALPFGIGAALAATFLATRLARGPLVRWRPLSLVGFIPHFLWRSLLGGVDVAWRALSPKPVLRPGFIDYPLSLPADVRRSVLAGEISLLPGTLAAGCHGDRMWVHCLDLEQKVSEAVGEEERGIGALGRSEEEEHGRG